MAHELARLSNMQRLSRLSALAAAADALIAAIVGSYRRDRRKLAAQRSSTASCQSEQSLRQLADTMPVIVWAARPDGNVDYYNRRWYELTGATEGVSGDASWLPILHPDDRQKCLDVWYESVRTGQPYQIEYRFRFTETGGYRWYLSRGLPVRDDDGNIVRWYGTSTDIDDFKRIEATLRESEERYRAAAEALQEADRRKDEFLAILSHELRNPLAPIRNSLVLLDKVPPGSEEATKARAIIDRQVGHMARLVDDLLDLTRVSRGKIRLQLDRLDLNELVRRTVEDHRSLFAGAGVELGFVPFERALWVQGDATRLAQVVGNLLQNATKFAAPAGRAVVRVGVDEGRAFVSVADTGMGIPKDVLPRLFEPFTQAERTLARSRGGLGLGLALVKALVELHGGKVSAHSEGEGRGAEFVVKLSMDETGVEDQLVPKTPAARRPRRVLIIEDNADAADSLRALLEFDGHQVEVAYSGMDGVNEARRMLPDVVLCDIGLPEMDGYEVARTMRSCPDLKPLCLVALTGYALAEDVDQSAQAGFDRHLAKPPDLALLEQILDTLPERSCAAAV